METINKVDQEDFYYVIYFLIKISLINRIYKQ